MHTDRLILTTRKPIHNASVATISRWVKSVLAESGAEKGVPLLRTVFAMLQYQQH